MPSIQKRENGKWRARYRDAAGKEHARHFPRKVDAQRWLDGVTASVVVGTYVDPVTAKMTVGEWCDRWLEGYAVNRPSSVRQAKTHVAAIKREFGTTMLSAVKPSGVKAWTVKLAAEGKAPSTVYAMYRRLSHIMGDAVHDGVIPRSPCSRRVSPPMGKQRPYVATTEQVWALHDAFPEHLRGAVLLGAFAGLRVAEAAGLRSVDVDFIRGVVNPAVQYPAEPLKSETSKGAVPIPNDLALMLSACVALGRGEYVVTDPFGQQTSPWAIERAMRDVRASVPGLPVGFRHHDLRHYFASSLIDAGLSVKVVQACLRHASATTTLNTYGHLFPDADESARAAIKKIVMARTDSSDEAPADSLRTDR